MADKDDVKEGKEFYVDVPAKNEPFFLKGSNSLDWGMQNRLARIFNPTSGRLTCEAGVTLATIQDLFVPRGWGLPVLALFYLFMFDAHDQARDAMALGLIDQHQLDDALGWEPGRFFETGNTLRALRCHAPIVPSVCSPCTAR